MNFEINFKPSMDYFEESYSEIIKSNWVKRFEPLFAIVMVLFSIGLWYYDRTGVLGLFPIFFGALGVFELVKVYHSRRKWLRDRAQSGVIGQDIRFQFTDDLIIHNGPFSNGNIKWTGIKSITETKKGVLVRPDTGVALYLPKSMFASEQIDFILSKGRK